VHAAAYCYSESATYAHVGLREGGPVFRAPTCILILFLCIQGVSLLVDITAGGDFLDLCDQNSLYKHVSDFGRLRSYGHF